MNPAETLDEFIANQMDYQNRSEIQVNLLRLLKRNIDKPLHVFTWLWQYIHRGGTQLRSVDIYTGKVAVNLRNGVVTIQADGQVLLHPCKRDAFSSTWWDSLNWALEQDDSALRNNADWISEITSLCRQYIHRDSLLLPSGSKYGYHLDACIVDTSWLSWLLQQVTTIVNYYPHGFVYQQGVITPTTSSLLTEGDRIEYVFYDGLVGWVIQVGTTVAVKDLLRLADIHPIDLIRNAAIIDRTLDKCVISALPNAE